MEDKITALEQENAIEKSHDNISPNKPSSSSYTLYSTRFAIRILCFIAISVLLLQIIISSKEQGNTIFNQWGKVFNNSNNSHNTTTTNMVQELEDKLRESVTFLPLKDLRYEKTAMEGHTWFMSSLNDTREQGEAQYQKFPSEASKGRVLCLKGRDPRDGSKNYYALAWSEALPQNASLMNGVTFVSSNYYDYGNVWHGLSATMAFVSWHVKNQCAVPKRWVLYHWGELRTSMAQWLETLLQATFGAQIRIETFDGIYRDLNNDPLACFEEALVMRHGEGEMSEPKRKEVYDLIRCKSRMHCNVSTRDVWAKNSSIVMTLFMRDGARSFENSTKVIDAFEKACKMVEGCQLAVAHARNLTVCEQVKLMSLTDILVSPHGAQLTNMILMDRNSSVMEFYPKGWLETAGVGQYVYHWLASWSGMRHEGEWRDPNTSEPCEHPDEDPRCHSLVKSRKIGCNETYFAEWAIRVLNDRVELRKNVSLNDQNGNITARSSPVSGICGCL